MKSIVCCLVVIGFAFGLIAPAAHAEDSSQKLGRGAVNATTGWMEVPNQMSAQMPDDSYKGMTFGFMDGLSRGIQRTLYGTWDLITFPFPPYDKPTMSPETLLKDSR